MFNAIIRSNRTILPTGVQKAAIAIENGKIAAVVTDFSDELPEETIDVGDNVLMAGIIDPHVHVNEPGRTDWEGFDTATRAAIAGGITTIVDMPLNSSPVTTTAQAFDSKAIDAMKSLHTDCGFWGGVVPGNANEIEHLVHKGVLGFKAFLVHSGIDEFPNVNEDDLRQAMPLIAKHGLPLLVHCEYTSDEETLDPGNKLSYKNYLASRPMKWEDDAIAMMIRLSQEYNCRVHIVHLSSSNSISQIAKAKEKGVPITVETAQHYLFFTAEEIYDGETILKCAPPIREQANNEKLWQALKDGIIDYVATDHSPTPPAKKHLDTGDFIKAWGGISSLQLALPALWTAARKHGCDLHQIAKWLCSAPAKISPPLASKGQLKVGSDADFVVWDPEEKFVVNEEMIHHRHKITPYMNKELYGVIKQTWLSGNLIFDNGKFLHLNKGRLVLNEA